MALKVLMLNQKRARLQQERDAIPDRSAEFQQREAQIAAAIPEAKTEEEQQAVETAVAEFEQERDAHNAKVKALDDKIAELTRQIQEEEAKQTVAPPSSPAADHNHPTTAPPVERKDDITMPNTRGRILGMSRAQFGELVQRDENKQCIARIREMGKNSRSISGGDLLISDSFMGLIRENVPLFSKLYKHVFVRHLSGTGRMTVMGTVPEGIWTEMCATLNQLSLGFSSVEMDGYMVGGYIPVCNALLEDSDIALAQEVLTAITKAIALALDKAIVYGTGTRMPMGIITRLTQPEKPATSKNSIEWKNLSNSHVKALDNKTGMELFQALLEASGEINTDYGTGDIFWAMNRKTKMKLMSESLGVNANGTIVAGMNNTMPVVGGEIETLAFFPDDVIIAGGDGLYALLERAGIHLNTYNQTLAVQNQTLFIGTSRYDGIPVIADGFVALSLGTTKPTADAVTFSLDKANQAAA